jgi:8-hydroxy-5-deazaflavin:NADPH oxidoreductase
VIVGSGIRKPNESDALPAGSPNRRALAIAGDDPDARGTVAGFGDRPGFDPVDAGSLAAARKFLPGTPIVELRFERDEVEREPVIGAAALKRVA